MPPVDRPPTIAPPEPSPAADPESGESRASTEAHLRPDVNEESERQRWPGTAPRRVAPDEMAGQEPEPDVSAAPRQELPLDLGLDGPTSVLATWKAGRTDPGRRGVIALAALAVVAVAVTAFVVLHGRPAAVPAPEVTAEGVKIGQESASPVPTGDVVVSVGGKVARPGVVTLPAGARVDDAIEAAGGATDPEGTGLMNLARRLVDGEQVLVGVDPPPGAPVGPAGVPGDSQVDLNAADASGLEQLSGIGPVLAERIVAWREEHGRFRSVDQLREVSGIGEAKFASIKDAVRV